MQAARSGELRADGCEVARSVMCDAVGGIADLLEPITKTQVYRGILGSSVIHLDVRRVIIQQPKAGGSSAGFVWIHRDREGRTVFDSPRRERARRALRMRGSSAGMPKPMSTQA
jgi:hypothetical protein